MVKKNFLLLDAGEQREFLAENLSNWMLEGFIPSALARTFHNRVGILAKKVKKTRNEVMVDLSMDALEIMRQWLDERQKQKETA